MGVRRAVHLSSQSMMSTKTLPRRVVCVEPGARPRPLLACELLGAGATDATKPGLLELAAEPVDGERIAFPRPKLMGEPGPIVSRD